MMIDCTNNPDFQSCLYLYPLQQDRAVTVTQQAECISPPLMPGLAL